MKKIFLSFTMAAITLSHTVFANDTNITNAEINVKTKLCSAIEDITLFSGGKSKIDTSKVQKLDSLRAKVGEVTIPHPDTLSFAVLNAFCFTISNTEIALEVEMAARGLTVNSFDPASGKFNERIQDISVLPSFGIVVETIAQKPELVGAFIDKVKEKRFGKNTIGIPEAKDILVEGSYKKELTADEEKFVNAMVEKYLDALAKSPN